MFFVKERLEIFCENITCIVSAGHSPNPHMTISVILADGMVACVG